MEAIENWLKENGITEVECLVADFTGIARGKIMPANKFMRERGIRLPESVALQSVTGDYVADDLYYKLIDPAEIDMRLHPDENAMFLVPWALEPTAQIIHDTYDKQGNPIELCPRNVLKKVMALYEAKGWSPVVAPELEFYLTKPCNDPDLPLEPPVGRSGRQESGRQSFSIDAANEYDPLFEDVYDYAEAMGLDVDTLIHEEGTAQMEINFLHGDPVNLADQVFLFKRVVREAALKHDVRATFMAKPVEDEPGSSMHVHQSLMDTKTGKNLFSNADGTRSELFMNYIAGLQKYIPFTMPLFAPNVNSYRRLLPDTSAPVNVEWGEDNRTVALRVPDSGPEALRIENRIAGADANPYLALAATLLCGYMGIMEGLQPSKPASGSAYKIRDRNMPVHLEHALEKMESSEEIKAMLGEKFIRAYVAVKRAEYENFKRVISSWEREYLLLTV
ncbi:glutamine synthetase family protein [Aestuariirhabdus litorea]|uniref:Glutamine synthetase n=1 Tax=Aestuariirhabdus litorea TaxID=2528527 RepID=A0A3P3VJ07_9GAMM|nr:glutamine synthetase family protein [Aestuariirhabdus litorea]RRJ82662.1 glutamine synthetase [Aestuariirhabdus litorea]RWW92822.1 glutamine synthetase [Endozoicomonadaceae bacterium GTF-13]